MVAPAVGVVLRGSCAYTCLVVRCNPVSPGPVLSRCVNKAVECSACGAAGFVGDRPFGVAVNELMVCPSRSWTQFDSMPAVRLVRGAVPEVVQAIGQLVLAYDLVELLVSCAGVPGSLSVVVLKTRLWSPMRFPASGARAFSWASVWARSVYYGCRGRWCGMSLLIWVRVSFGSSADLGHLARSL